MNDTIKTVLIDGGTPVALADGETRFIYNLLPVGKFYDKRYGEVNITPEKIKKMADNFGHYPSYEVPVKLGHEQGAKSPGKVISVEAKDNGLEITMLVDQETAKAINDKQYRYMSAEFVDDYFDKNNGKNVGPVLCGAALVNQPGHPNVAPLVLIDNINQTEKGDNELMNELDDLRSQLSDLKAQKAQTEAELKAARELSEANAKKLADIEAQNKSLIEERERAENAKNEAEVKAFCDKWTGQGIPPVVVEKVKPLLLAKTSRVIKLSDDVKDDINSLKFFDDLFAGLPKMNLGQTSKNEAPKIELSDVQTAKERAKAIADSVI